MQETQSMLEYQVTTDPPTVMHVLVTSRFGYGNVHYVGLPLETAWELQPVQNMAEQMLVGASRLDHFSPVRWQLHSLTIIFQAQFKMLVLTYKILCDLGHGCLKDHRAWHVLHSWCGSWTRGKAFLGATLLLWNSLPRVAHLAHSLMVFQAVWRRTDLFRWAFSKAWCCLLPFFRVNF